MDGVEFVDDGTDYDVKANDGILTSKTLFTYNQGQSTLLPGQMTLVKNNSVIYTNEFLHSDKVNSSGSVAKIKITCTFSWIKCSSWPSNIQSLCYSTSWPFSGYFEIKECSITYED